MGGLVDFEVVRHLRSMGKDWPLHLFVSATSALHIPDLDNYHLLPNDQLIVQLRKDGGYGEDVLGNAEFMEILFPAIRADAAVTETYLNTSKGRRSMSDALSGCAVS